MQLVMISYFALGDDVVEKLLVDDGSISLLLQMKAEEDPDLSLIRLIGRVHLPPHGKRD